MEVEALVAQSGWRPKEQFEGSRGVTLQTLVPAEGARPERFPSAEVDLLMVWVAPEPYSQHLAELPLWVGGTPPP